MLKSCKYCGKIHDSKFDCGKKLVRKKQTTDVNKFRWSRRWREKRNQIVERDKCLCKVCKANGVFVYDDLEVHHIVPIEENYDLRMDEDNLITLCGHHHEEAERGDISKEYLYKLLNIPPR